MIVEKTFKCLKLYKMKRRRRALIKQVAQEFYEEKLRKEIEAGRTKMKLNRKKGVLLNENQELMLKVLTEWRHTSKWLSRHGYRLDHMIESKRKLTLLKVFLAMKQTLKQE